MRVSKLIAFAFAVLAGALALLLQPRSGPKVTVAYAAAHNNHDDDGLNDELAEALATAGFTGNIQQIFQQRLEANLGRPIDPKLRISAGCCGLTKLIPCITCPSYCRPRRICLQQS